MKVGVHQGFALGLLLFITVMGVLARPGRFPGIAGSAGNHGDDGKFQKSHNFVT